MSAEKKRKFEEEAPAAIHGPGCIANNCLLVGTVSDSTKGGPFHCWAHDRLQEASQWPF